MVTDCGDRFTGHVSRTSCLDLQEQPGVRQLGDTRGKCWALFSGLRTEERHCSRRAWL